MSKKSITLGVAICALAAGLLLVPAAEADAHRLSARLNSCGPDCCEPCCEPVCSKPCIRYRDRSCLRDCCVPRVESTLSVTEPCTCCTVEVPICLPTCCEGEPTVCCRKGFAGRSTVTYEWCCGFTVEVLFRARGDVVVTYR